MNKFFKSGFLILNPWVICAGCACYFESRNFYKITLSEIEFKHNFES